MHRRQFIGGVGVGIALISGCLGGNSDTTAPDAGSQQDGGSKQTAKPETTTPEPTPEKTAEPTAEPTPDAPPEERIDFTREDDDPEVVGTLLAKGSIPGVVVSSDLPSAKAWQNYATVDEENSTYKVGISVSANSAIGRLTVVGKMYDEAGELLSEDHDVSNNIPSGEKALIHLAFDGDIDEMYYFEISLLSPN